jgi:spore germination cell wall hydrolase CwlJ-like protein
VVKLLGGRAAAVVIGFLMLAIGSSANAQDVAGSQAQLIKQAVAATLAQPAVAAQALAPTLPKASLPAASAGTLVTQAPAASSVTVKVPAAIATEAAWLYKGGWPLEALVGKYATNAALDEETNCLATAVYFEARGESVEGQLAVARVVMNRAASGRYPPDWCGVVKQPAQFSFVRHGEFPYVDTNSYAWQKAEAVAELAAANVVPSLSNDVLWYHADYVAPTWRRSLQEVQQIGAHIFYRA